MQTSQLSPDEILGRIGGDWSCYVDGCSGIPEFLGGYCPKHLRANRQAFYDAVWGSAETEAKG